MKKFFADILTQNDNRTWCIGRVSLFLGTVSFIVIGFIHAILNHTMDFSAFGMGLGRYDPQQNKITYFYI